jgi:3-deoxy-D-manno-octulosonic-acid transferase
MFNFEEATGLAVEARAAVQIADPQGLGVALAELLRDAPRREQMAKAGLELMRQHQGATVRTVALLNAALKAPAGEAR